VMPIITMTQVAIPTYPIIVQAIQPSLSGSIPILRVEASSMRFHA
jgi:hypothetical protein